MARMEMRVSSERAELIRRAAAARGESVTSFVVQAATRAAEEELAIERETLLPSDFFESLLAALDDPDEVPGALRDLSNRPRSFIRR